MTGWMVSVTATVAIIALSAFFVILEFSLLAARQHRLEESAEHSRSSRAALRSLNELTVMLAGAQLGITACTFALGAVSKPAVHYALMPVFLSWSMPAWLADAVAFTLALLVMTFLHLVVGEMAPKSWAIAHPERAARAVAIAARAFLWCFRPLLLWINSLANRLVAATGVEPVDRAAAGGYDTETIGHLVEHSTRAGVLDEASGSQISRIIELESLTVQDVIAAKQEQGMTAVPPEATVADVQRLALRTGHLRVLIHPPSGSPPSIVHVRDTLQVPGDHRAVALSRPALVVPAEDSVYQTFQRMREAGEQLAVVRAGREFTGVITWSDILDRVWPNVEEQWR
ncbi:CNNM domain-containing protein [Sediminivirga luteola]|uniref:CNNM domain-containing protein n=1 Tax=Sediminivirga luteola TaxID=1774748 RepID=UPI001F5AA413|nr:hemolysin family protein [Sediminivirga luteola]MCI2266230.1 hemolysin family protein [Sediminivirga luteola]